MFQGFFLILTARIFSLSTENFSNTDSNTEKSLIAKGFYAFSMILRLHFIKLSIERNIEDMTKIDEISPLIREFLPSHFITKVNWFDLNCRLRFPLLISLLSKR